MLGEALQSVFAKRQLNTRVGLIIISFEKFVSEIANSKWKYRLHALSPSDEPKVQHTYQPMVCLIFGSHFGC